MNVLEAIQLRHSVREYRPDPVPSDMLRTLAEAARLAPSSRNLQPLELIIVTDPAQRRALRAAANDQAHVEQAAATFVCLGSLRQQDLLADRLEAYLKPETPPDRRQEVMALVRRMRHDDDYRRAHVTNSAYIGISYMTLAATELGLGTCWMTSFNPDTVRALLGVPTDCLIVALLSVGWPARPLEPLGHMRRSLDQMIHWETY